MPLPSGEKALTDAPHFLTLTFIGGRSFDPHSCCRFAGKAVPLFNQTIIMDEKEGDITTEQWFKKILSRKRERGSQMRKHEKEIRDEKEILEILEKGLVCHLGLCDEGQPYVVPMNYGYRDRRMYFHCAREGRKIDILRNNNRVCIEVESEARIVKGETPCRWTAKYRSVIGFGRARIIEVEKEKKSGLDVIMKHYGGSGNGYDETSLQRTLVIEVILESLTGKQSL